MSKRNSSRLACDPIVGIASIKVSEAERLSSWIEPLSIFTTVMTIIYSQSYGPGFDRLILFYATSWYFESSIANLTFKLRYFALIKQGTRLQNLIFTRARRESWPFSLSKKREIKNFELEPEIIATTGIFIICEVYFSCNMKNYFC